MGSNQGIQAGEECDDLSEAAGLAAQPAIGQIEYVTTDGARSDRPHTNFTEHARLMEPKGCVVIAIMLLQMGFHTDGLQADEHGALRNAMCSHGMPQEQLPQIHLCMN